MTLRELIALQKRAGVLASEFWMDGVLAEGKTRLAPVDEGTLRGTGARDTHDLGDRVEITGYFSTPYARRQHESHTVGEYMAAAGQTSSHPNDPVRHPGGGGAKFLEAPFKQAVPRLEPLIARAIRQVTP